MRIVIWARSSMILKSVRICAHARRMIMSGMSFLTSLLSAASHGVL
jgi:hypothetical protein